MFRFLVLLIVVGAIAAWWLGYLPPRQAVVVVPSNPQAERPVNPDVARQRGAEVGGQVADGVNRVVRGVDDAALTAKIKSKMALDDVVQARNVDVDTVNGVVTLSGRVGSAAERQRALELARQTAGVSSVVDRMSMQ